MSDKNKQPTFYVHDYETFGQRPALDRPAQFAGVRTDLDFNLVEEPLVIYCKPADDYLPQPEAVMITGITPQHALANGVNEAEFSAKYTRPFRYPAPVSSATTIFVLMMKSVATFSIVIFMILMPTVGRGEIPVGICWM